MPKLSVAFAEKDFLLMQEIAGDLSCPLGHVVRLAVGTGLEAWGKDERPSRMICSPTVAGPLPPGVGLRFAHVEISE